METGDRSPEANFKKEAFKSIVFGSPFKILLFITWAFLMISTPFGVRIDFGIPTQPPIVFVALIIRNTIFYLAIFSAIRPDSFQKAGYVVLAGLLSFFTTPFLTSILELASMGSYLVAQILIVRQLEPAVNYFAKPPGPFQPPPRSGKITLIVILEMVGYLVVIWLLNFIPTDLYFLEFASYRFGYWIMPALLMLVVAALFYFIIASKKDPFHAHLQRQFTVIIPLLLGMGIYLAYRFWTFSQTYESHVPSLPEVTYGVSETINAFLLFGLMLWTLYSNAGQKERSRRYYGYILWLYTLTLYNVWFEAMFEAQGLYMVVLLFTGVGVFFMVRALTKNFALRVGLPPKTRFRDLLFKEQKIGEVLGLYEVKLKKDETQN